MAQRSYDSIESEAAHSALIEHYDVGAGLYKMWASPRSVLSSTLFGWEKSGHPGQLHYAWDLEKGRSLDDAIRQATANALAMLEVERIASPRIFDPGCGIGGATLQVAGMLPGATVVGMSLVQKQIEIANSRMRAAGLSNAEFALGNYLKTPFPDGIFDGIYALEALCYTPKAEKHTLFGEFYRLLRPGRRLVIFDGCSLREPRGDDERRWVLDVLEGWTMPWLCTSGEIVAFAEAAGFRLVRSENVTHRVYRSAQRIKWIATHMLRPLARVSKLPGASWALRSLGFGSPAGAGRFADACASQIKIFDSGLGAYYVHVFDKVPRNAEREPIGASRNTATTIQAA